MGWIKRIYSYVGIIAFSVLCSLMNLNVLTVPTVIVSAITLSFLESSMIFDLQKKLLRHTILVIIMLPINMFISYRVLFDREYNVVSEYIIFLTILFVFPIIIGIKEFIQLKKSKINGIYKSDFKIYAKLFIVMLIILDLSLPLVLKQFRDNDLVLERIKIYTIEKDEIYIKDKNDEMRDRIKEKIESLERIKRSSAIEQLNIIKESALEGREKYVITCNISGHYGNIVFLKDNKVYLKIKKENTFLDGMIGTKNDYYILNLSDQSKDEIDKILNE